MTRLATTNLQYRRTKCLVAMLLALLVAISSLNSHAAMDTHQIDCGLASQTQLFGGDTTTTDDTRCSACSMLPSSGVLAVAEPPFPAFAPALAMVSHRLPPPRRPPKS